MGLTTQGHDVDDGLFSRLGQSARGEVIAQSTRNNDRASARSTAFETRCDAGARGAARISPWRVEYRRGPNLFRRVITANTRPTAVICGNRHLTVGALLEGLAMGLEVPEEFARGYAT